MPSKILGHHKKPILRAFSVYTFQSSFKKSISITPTKRANRSSHHQFACSRVCPFHSFHSFRLLRSSSVHSCAPAAHASVTATLAWHFVPCSLRSHSFTHSFISLFRSFVCACRSRVSHHYTRLALRAMLASLTRQSPLHSPGTSCHARFAHTHSLHCSTHSFRCFVRSLIPLISRPTPFTCFPHMPGSYVDYLHDQSSIQMGQMKL